jgi:hypothetical protein
MKDENSQSQGTPEQQAATADAPVIDETTQQGAGGATADAEATPPAGGEATGTEAPAFDPEKMNAVELRDMIAKMESGEDPVAAPAPAKADEPVAETAKTPEQELAAQADAPAFAFTDGSDYDTFTKEADEYLAQVELDPAAEALVTRLRQEAEVARSEAAKAADIGVTDTTLTQAFDQLVEFREDLGEFVPDTTGVITTLQTKFPGEMSQLIEDLNILPSTKYPGHTRYQQFIRDAFDLSDAAMAKLDYFVRNGGQMPHPAYVPEGLNEQLAEAYWTAENREEFQQQLAAAAFTINEDTEATAADKEKATETIRRINGQLSQIQGGINAHRQRLEEVKRTELSQAQQINNKSVDRFVDVTRGIIENLAAEATKGLADSLGADGADLTGLSIANLVETAFSDNQEYAKYAQDKLSAKGITADWPAALATRDELFTAVKKVVYLENAPGVNQRAIDNAKKGVDGVVKKLLGLAREAGGKINAKVVTSQGKKLEKDISTAPRQAFARPKASAATAGSSAAKPNYDTMSVEELRSRIGEMQRAQRAGGAP